MVFETIRELLMDQLVILEDLEAEREDLAELMLSLEQEFDISWSDNDLRTIRTVGDLTAFVENQL